MPKKDPQTDVTYGTRYKRRNAVKSILTCLLAVRDAEQKYFENVPNNLQGSETFEVGEYALDTLDEIIGLLAEVY